MLKLGDRVRQKSNGFDGIVIHVYKFSLADQCEVATIATEINRTNIVITRKEIELEFIEEASTEFLLTHSYGPVREMGRQKARLEATCLS